MDRDKVKVTDCKTVTNTKIEHTRHGIVRREVTRDVKTAQTQKARGEK